MGLGWRGRGVLAAFFFFLLPSSRRCRRQLDPCWIGQACNGHLRHMFSLSFFLSSDPESGVTGEVSSGIHDRCGAEMSGRDHRHISSSRLRIQFEASRTQASTDSAWTPLSCMPAVSIMHRTGSLCKHIVQKSAERSQHRQSIIITIKEFCKMSNKVGGTDLRAHRFRSLKKISGRRGNRKGKKGFAGEVKDASPGCREDDTGEKPCSSGSGEPLEALFPCTARFCSSACFARPGAARVPSRVCDRGSRSGGLAR